MPAKQRTLLAALERALEADHCDQCEDAACDINAAYREGYYLWAGHLMEGATDCPETERAMGRLRAAMRPETFRRKLDKERDGLVASPHWQCQDCNAVNWEDPREVEQPKGVRCNACHAWNDLADVAALETQSPLGGRAIMLPPGHCPEAV